MYFIFKKRMFIAHFRGQPVSAAILPHPIPRKYKGPYTPHRAHGHITIDIFVIAQQLACCPQSKTNPLSTCFLITNIGLHV